MRLSLVGAQDKIAVKVTVSATIASGRFCQGLSISPGLKYEDESGPGIEKSLDPIDAVFLYEVISLTGEIADMAERVGRRLELLLAH